MDHTDMVGSFRVQDTNRCHHTGPELEYFITLKPGGEFEFTISGDPWLPVISVEIERVE